MQSFKGFTIIELVITLIIIGIMAAFLIPLWPGDSINLSTQATQVAGDILYTQFLSLTTGQRYQWVMTSTTTYQIQNSSGTPIVYPGTGNSTITLESGISFGSLVNLPNNLIAFDGKGTPYTTTGSPGTALTSQATIPLAASSSSESVIITPTTGWVDIQ